MQGGGRSSGRRMFRYHGFKGMTIWTICTAYHVSNAALLDNQEGWHGADLVLCGDGFMLIDIYFEEDRVGVLGCSYVGAMTCTDRLASVSQYDSVAARSRRPTLHGPHQVAKKSTTIGWSFSLAALSVVFQ